MTDVKGNYPKSKQGNFKVVDTIGVPHPYCITSKHVAWAADHCGGMLGKEAIREAEEHGAKCDICKKQGNVLTIDEHEQALLVGCKVDIQPLPDELKDWLISIKEEATANGYAGFAFKVTS